MKSRVTWVGEKAFWGQTEEGFSVVLGTATESAPKPGPSAMEFVLLGAGGCSAWDVVEILRKGRQEIEDVVVELDADRAEDPPSVFTAIRMHFIVRGRNLDPGRVERAVSLSAEKYCSVTRMLEKTATVTHTVEVIDTSG